ncbi:MAG TPA: sugar phosphate nucleotidyltransferase [Candidatus Poseidoniaceae archaeon]|nr:sugar phosphate nucleotidyltransferase [Candidatus Poseidoniaceae archaeon]
MRAIILAGGRGKRLGGLTDSRSKVMLPLAGKPMLEWLLHVLEETEVKEVTIVYYYAGERILTHFGSGRDYNLNIQFVKQHSDRGTVGSLITGLSTINENEDDRVLILNGDNMVDSSSINSLLKIEGNGLIVSEHDTPHLFGVVEFRGTNIKSITEKPDINQIRSRMVSTGVWYLKREVIEKIKLDFEEGQTELSTSISKQIKEGLKIESVRTENWHDVDHPWDLNKLNRFLLEKMERLISDGAEITDCSTINGDVQIGKGTIIHPGCVIQGPVHIAENCEIGPLAVITGSTSISSGCRIGPFTRIRSSLIMRDVQIDSNCSIHHSIIGPATSLKSNVEVDAASVQKIVRNTHYQIRRLGLVTGEACMLEQGVICAPGTMLGSQVLVGRRTKLDGEYETGTRLIRGA